MIRFSKNELDFIREKQIPCHYRNEPYLLDAYSETYEKLLLSKNGDLFSHGTIIDFSDEDFHVPDLYKCRNSKLFKLVMR